VATIVWLSLTPLPPQVDFKEGDKVGHFLAYGLLMGWFCLLYRGRHARLAYGAAFVAMGIGLELAQGALGYRAYEVFDMCANTFGVLLGWAGAQGLLRLAPRILRL